MTRRRAMNLLVVLGGLALGVALSAKPWQVFGEQKQRALDARAEMQSAETSRNALIRQKSRLESPLGREQLARDQGYSKPGEIPVGSQ